MRLLPASVALFAALLAMSSPAAGQGTALARIEGRVTDSARARPLAGAAVLAIRLTPEPQVFLNAVANAEGRFRLDSLVAGRYAVSFTAPLLDSLGLVIPDREVLVVAGERQVVELALPAGAALRATVCPGPVLAAGTGALMGTVRDATTEQPVGGARVVIMWNEISVDRATLSSRTAVRSGAALADSLGNYRLCGAPTGTRLALQAQRGAASGSPIDIVVDDRLGILRQDLSFTAGGLAASQPLTGADSAPTPRSTGAASVQGRVLGPNDQPLGDVQLRIANARSVARSDSLGRYTLSGLPEGTQMLEARRIGYQAASQVLELRAGQVASRDLRLARIVTLDSIRTIAQRARYPEFERHRQSGRGTFLDERDIAKRNPFWTSDILRAVNGFAVRGDGFEQKLVSGRGALFDGRDCVTNVVIDGHEGMEINAVHPSDIARLEIYQSAADAPLPYNAACGLILIWTKR